MQQQVDKKRKPRTYKATDEDYQNAFAKAKNSNTTLAKEIEKFIIRYSKK